MKDIMKMVKSLEDSGLLLKRVSETIQNEAKEQKRRFLSMLLSTLGASLLGNMLSGKGITLGASLLGNMLSGKGITKAGLVLKVN